MNCLSSDTFVQVLGNPTNIPDVVWCQTNDVVHVWLKCHRWLIKNSPLSSELDAIRASPMEMYGTETFVNCSRDPNRSNSVLSSFNFGKFCCFQCRMSWMHFSSLAKDALAFSLENLNVYSRVSSMWWDYVSTLLLKEASVSITKLNWHQLEGCHLITRLSMMFRYTTSSI